MAGHSAKSNPHRARKRVEVETSALKRARDGSAFTRCEACNKDVSVALIDMHSCSLDSKIRMNLESQVVEEIETKKKPVERKRAAPSDAKERKGKLKKNSNNPNKPKRPLTAFFLFMEDFRKEYKEAHPDSKGVTSVTKEGGEKWRLMTDEDKKVYTDKAAELKAEYAKAIDKSDDGDEEVKEDSEKEEEVKEKAGSDKEEEAEENEE